MTTEIEDDDPVLEAPYVCEDCHTPGTITPLFDNDGILRCDPCRTAQYEQSLRELRRIIAETSTEIFIDYHVRVGIRVPNYTRSALLAAKLRALEIIMGMPMHDDAETWEHDFIEIVDAEGATVQEVDDEP